MQRDPRAWLWDVRDAASAIAQFTAGLNVEAYASTPLVHQAVDALLQELGQD